MVNKMTKEIPLANGKGYALVDDEDYKRAMEHRWCKHGQGYAHGNVHGKDLLMHRWLVDAPKGMDVDHSNMDKLDNRRSNLRVCTRSQNKANISLNVANTSGYKGVYWSNSNKGWMARIKRKQKTIYLGTFDDPADAGRAYDQAAKKYFGKFARLNFPQETE